ncbi:MAG: hypothetical protein WC947_10930 [Elusimicrobiota bacterium]
MRYNRNMRKKITIVAVILLALVAVFAIWAYITTNKKSQLLSGDECAQKGGEVVNTLAQKTWNDKDIIGEVDGMRCPCLCVKKINRSGMFLLE